MPEARDERLLLIVERIERLIEERKGISDDIRDVYAEAKAVGYDTRMIRHLIQRRAMKPDDRAEVDALTGTYEAAIGMAPAEGVPTIDELRPDAAALAASLLAEQIVGLEEPDQAKALVDHVLWLLDLRAEIALLRVQERERKVMAKAEGFDAKQVHQTVRWFEKVAKHGEEAMRLGEQTFQLYRATVEAPPDGRTVTEDSKLAALFTPAPTKPTAKTRGLSSARAAAELARRATNGEI